MMLIKIAATFLLLSSPLMTAKAAQTCCVCQIGEKPVKQQHWFKKGCQIWLKNQKDCSWKIRSVIQRAGVLKLPESCQDGTLHLGYVGHWADSAETKKFIDELVVPTQRQLNLNIRIDNTACLAMRDAELVQNHIEQLPMPKKKYLVVKGNQVTSVGLWEAFLPGKSNFYAIADSRTSETRYPFCWEFEGKLCTKSVQKNESAICKDQASHLKKLTCRSNNRSDDERSYRWLASSTF